MPKNILRRKDLIFPELSYIVIGCAFDVHNEIGGGHPEKYYQDALAEAFARRRLQYKEQVYTLLRYGSKVVGKKFLDFLIADKVIVEIKKGNRFSKSNIDQVLEYLKTNNLQLAILINFGSDGVAFKRIVNFS